MAQISAKTGRNPLHRAHFVDADGGNEGIGSGELPSLLIADKSDFGGDFRYSTYRVQEQVGGDLRNLDLQQTEIDTARAEFDEELDAGLRLINYLGHAGMDRSRQRTRERLCSERFRRE